MASALSDYKIVIRRDDNETFVAYVPAIDGRHAWGASAAEALAELTNVFDMIREEYEEEGRPLPPDVELAVRGAL